MLTTMAPLCPGLDEGQSLRARAHELRVRLQTHVVEQLACKRHVVFQQTMAHSLHQVRHTAVSIMPACSAS